LYLDERRNESFQKKEASARERRKTPACKLKGSQKNVAIGAGMGGDIKGKLRKDTKGGEDLLIGKGRDAILASWIDLSPKLKRSKERQGGCTSGPWGKERRKKGGGSGKEQESSWGGTRTK